MVPAWDCVLCYLWRGRSCDIHQVIDSQSRTNCPLILYCSSQNGELHTMDTEEYQRLRVCSAMLTIFFIQDFLWNNNKRFLACYKTRPQSWSSKLLVNTPPLTNIEPSISNRVWEYPKFWFSPKFFILGDKVNQWCRNRGTLPSATPVLAISPKRKHIFKCSNCWDHLLTFVRYVLAPQDDFGIKKTW